MSAKGLGQRLKGTVKELVAEVTGDARLQEAGREEIAEGHRDGAPATEPPDPQLGDRHPRPGRRD